jgi:hypothetical protein
MRTKFERREAAQTARSAAPEGKKVPANDANPREWEKRDFAQTHASGRWLGSLPQGSPKGDMSGSEGGNAQRR